MTPKDTMFCNDDFSPLFYSIIYRVVMITFFNGRHYVAKIVHHNQWYVYDGCQSGLVKTSFCAPIQGAKASTVIYKVLH